MHIIQQGDALILYDTENFQRGMIFYPSSGQRWINGTTAIPLPPPPPPITGGDTTPPTTPIPPPNTGINDAVVTKMHSYLGTLKYSQAAGRLNPDTSGYSDCSALIWFCFKRVRGIEVGQWSGAQATRGTNIYTGAPENAPLASLQKGDLIVWNRKLSRIPVAGLNEGHAALWYGSGNQIIDHGSGMGPKVRAYSTFNYAPWVTIRRHD